MAPTRCRPGRSRPGAKRGRPTTGFPEGTFEQIAAVLAPDEDRTDLVRKAVEREIARRQKAKEKPRRSGDSGPFAGKCARSAALLSSTTHRHRRPRVNRRDLRGIGRRLCKGTPAYRTRRNRAVARVSSFAGKCARSAALLSSTTHRHRRPRVNRRDLRGDRAPPRSYRLSAPKPSQTRAWRRFEYLSPYEGVRPHII